MKPGDVPAAPDTELLAPAGSFEKLVTAVHYGADAVYLAGKRFSLRARAGNFDAKGLEQAVDYAHARGVKVYVTVNIFAHNRDFEGLGDYLRFLQQAQVDGLIIADPAAGEVAYRLSTSGIQMTSVNVYDDDQARRAARFAK